MLTPEQINLIAGAMPEWGKYDPDPKVVWWIDSNHDVMLKDGELTKAGAFDIMEVHDMNVKQSKNMHGELSEVTTDSDRGVHSDLRTAIAQCLLAKLEGEK